MYFSYLIPILPLLDLLGLLAAQSTLVAVPSSTAVPPKVPTCYSPDQSIAIHNYACNLSANVSACCGIGAVCLDNKLCENGDNQIIGGSCTDLAWQSSECPQYCLGEFVLFTATAQSQLHTNEGIRRRLYWRYRLDILP